MYSMLQYFIVLLSLSIVSQASETFVNSKLIYNKGGAYYYPNVGLIPQGSTITKIGISVGGQIDRFVVYYTTPLNNTYMIDGFGSSTRVINEVYQLPIGNVIHTIRFATGVDSKGFKNFVGVQFIGTLDTSPYYEGSYKQNIQTTEYIYLDYRPVAFFGYIQQQYRSICGFGVVMAKPQSQEEKIEKKLMSE